MKSVYYRFIQKSQLFPLFNLTEGDGLRHILPFIHQDDCQQDFWHRCRVGNVNNKIKIGGKFKAMTLLGAVKHKHDTINRQKESDYKKENGNESGGVNTPREKNHISKNIGRIREIEQYAKKCTNEKDISRVSSANLYNKPCNLSIQR